MEYYAIILNDNCEDYRAFQKNTYVLMKKQVLKLYAHCNYNFVKHSYWGKKLEEMIIVVILEWQNYCFLKMCFSSF